MLIAKSVKDGDYIVVKLANGEEVLGRQKDATGDVLTLSKARVLMQTQNGIALIPYMQLADDNADVPVAKSHIVTIMPMKDELKKEFIQVTSNIQTAPAGVDLNLGG